MKTLILGAVLGVSSLVLYAASGYGRGVVLLWLAALLVLSAAFWSASERLPRVATADLLAAAGLVVAFAPLYLARIYSWPAQVNSDEVAIMTYAEAYAARDDVDLFGVSDYLGHPSALLVLMGSVGELLGGVELLRMRLLHASLGLAVIAVSYALFRQLLPRRWAIFAASVLGCSHSLLMISRMAMRENTAVLIEVAAFALLLRGLRHGHSLSTFLGGAVAGLGFYVYYPARFTIVLWAAALLGLALIGRSVLPVERVVRLAAVAATGFVLVATPIVVAEQKAPAGKVALQRHALLIFPEARETQRDWVFASSVSEGIRKNVVWGLTTFNNTVVDHSWIYPNYAYGFVDPFTGALLWVGVAVVILALFRRRDDPWPLVFLGGFAILFLTFALLVNKAPNYTRLLVTLPFVAFLVTAGVRFLAGLAGRLAARWRPAYAKGAAAAVSLGALVLIVGANLWIAWDFVQVGRERGDYIGSTGRYIESNRGGPSKTFYIATVDAEPYRYYEWGYPGIWKERLSIFAGDPSRVGEVISPDALSDLTARPPFAVFMRRELWSEVGTDLIARYPQGRVQDIVPDGSRVVLDVPAK
jgi:Dolichyl-phosphate-mannose-protein mannosyltransferase